MMLAAEIGISDSRMRKTLKNYSCNSVFRPLELENLKLAERGPTRAVMFKIFHATNWGGEKLRVDSLILHRGRPA